MGAAPTAQAERFVEASSVEMAINNIVDGFLWMLEKQGIGAMVIDENGEIEARNAAAGSTFINSWWSHGDDVLDATEKVPFEVFADPSFSRRIPRKAWPVVRALTQRSIEDQTLYISQGDNKARVDIQAFPLPAGGAALAYRFLEVDSDEQ